jgi:hypothetical protein
VPAETYTEKDPHAELVELLKSAILKYEDALQLAQVPTAELTAERALAVYFAINEARAVQVGTAAHRLAERAFERERKPEPEVKKCGVCGSPVVNNRCNCNVLMKSRQA